jgi:hypothetical protein
MNLTHLRGIAERAYKAAEENVPQEDVQVGSGSVCNA